MQLTLADIGAWILKGNPKMYAVQGLIGQPSFDDDWVVNPTYRTDLMEPGQRVYLYVGGSQKDPVPGIYAVGKVTRRPFAAKADEHWVDESDRGRPSLKVGILLGEIALRCTRRELQAEPALAQMELLRNPIMGNPVVVRPEENAILARLAHS
ncbi:EVE domain-containing protein [Nocardioides cheoyonin]|uniref:EVE domain-containing protein n=1 Tax=Nocardioides cheoyonin TaxID=3156615 RepID=UPI0032B435CC